MSHPAQRVATVSDLLIVGFLITVPRCGTRRPPMLPTLREGPTVKKALTVATTGSANLSRPVIIRPA